MEGKRRQYDKITIFPEDGKMSIFFYQNIPDSTAIYK